MRLPNTYSSLKPALPTQSRMAYQLPPREPLLDFRERLLRELEERRELLEERLELEELWERDERWLERDDEVWETLARLCRRCSESWAHLARLVSVPLLLLAGCGRSPNITVPPSAEMIKLKFIYFAYFSGCTPPPAGYSHAI